MLQKPSFNYFCSGVCMKYIGTDLNELALLVVEYNDHPLNHGPSQTRIPGGTIQFEDIINAIVTAGPRTTLSSDHLVWIKQTAEKIANECDTKIASMLSNTREEKFALRAVFTNALTDIEDAFYSLQLSEKDIKIIEDASKEATLRRELKAECAVTTWGGAVQCGYLKRGEHFQYPYLVTGSDAPDTYEGSPDDDILKSYFMPLDELFADPKILYKNHVPFLNNALSTFMHILTYEKEHKAKLIEKIKEYLKPTN